MKKRLAALRFCLKSLGTFLLWVIFVGKTDYRPVVYLQKMQMVDSRLARTMEDWSNFDYVIDYLR